MKASDEIEAEIAELSARHDPSNQDAQDRAVRARTCANDSHAAASPQAFIGTGKFAPSPGLKELYREVAKRIHPDLTADPVERHRRQQLMAAANLAYEHGDEARLRKILHDYESSPEVVQGEGTAAELVRAIRKIAQARNRIIEIGAEAELLIQSDLYKLMQKAEEAKEQGRDLLNEMAEMVEGQITSARERLQQVSRSYGA
jgi:hypothetical protein